MRRLPKQEQQARKPSRRTAHTQSSTRILCVTSPTRPPEPVLISLDGTQDVDVIYIGTPHSHHYKCAHDALSAGKAVLCEKSLTVNAAQAKALVALARAKNLFFMEAVRIHSILRRLVPSTDDLPQVWLRFQPVSYKVQEILASGVIGQVRSVAADLSIDFQPDTKDASHRMISPALAGGALLDLGPYPWTWLAMLLLPKSSASNSSIPVPPTVGSMTKLVPSGVDASTVAVIQFPQEDGRILHGTLTTALDAQTTPGRAVLVQGSKGFLEVHRYVLSPPDPE
jgi:predicted dehydrogenase